jgi:hypothetical protein
MLVGGELINSGTYETREMYWKNDKYKISVGNPERNKQFWRSRPR